MELAIIILFYIIVLLYSIILHEISHGLAALWLGDTTAKDSGRLTLDPLPHVDPVGSFFLPLAMILTTGFAFGWAKPVPYNPANLRWKKWGDVAVAFVGPVTNFALATIAAVFASMISLSTLEKREIIIAMQRIADGEIVQLIAGDMSAIFFAVCIMVIFWNVLLGVFNLIPIPPLDGSKLLLTLVNVPLNIRMALEKWGFVIILVVLLTPLGGPFRLVLESLWNFFYGIAL